MDGYKGKRLFVDMDGTLARFHDQVNYLEGMFEKDFFRELKPFENMVSAVKLFMKDHPDIEVYILSACVSGNPYCTEEKNAWLDEHLPEIDIDHRIYTEMGKSKAEFIPGGISDKDYLLDDYNKGLNLWLYDGGSAIKCHNNINQKGLGAYGGSAGMLWTGKMVHTEDSPELISAELQSHMGLAFYLDKAISSAKEQISYSEFTPGSRLDPYPFKPGITSYLTRIHADKYNPQRFEARWYEPRETKQTPHNYSRSATEVFKNPLNAIRWLESKPGFNEIQLQCSDGDKLYIPYFQADALATNLYGRTIQDLLSYSNRDNYSEIADSFRLALEKTELPIVGLVQYLGSDGRVGETAIFRNAEEMKAEIDECQDCGRPISAEWFVQPRLPITLYCSPDLGAPELFTLYPDNLRKAAEVCGFTIDSIDDFLEEYTWDDSSAIWNAYGQYVDQIANIMDGFASREQVEKAFYSMMASSENTPVDTAKTMLINISEWARWHNEEALQAGVMDKAIDLHASLSGISKEPEQKSSLDAMISSAQGKQEKLAKQISPEIPER